VTQGPAFENPNLVAGRPMALPLIAIYDCPLAAVEDDIVPQREDFEHMTHLLKSTEFIRTALSPFVLERNCLLDESIIIVRFYWCCLLRFVSN
jgi:hypothetical protein